jgi:hypothetical protein
METIELNGEKVHLKKDYFGWRIIYPYRNEDGSINWINLLFGGRKNLVTLILYMLIVFLLYMGIQELISAYKVIANNPCGFCSSCYSNSYENTFISLEG